MEIIEKKRTKFLRFLKGILPVLLLLLLAVLFSKGIQSTGRQALNKEQENLLSALESGAVRTYAMEGRYPESLDLLLETYHITYDQTKFIVEYVPNGSNLFPSISVLPLG